MKKLVSFLFCSVVFFSGCTLSALDTQKSTQLQEKLIASKAYNSTTDLASSVAPAIVGIGATSYSGESVGSGVCVGENGLIITNSHVVNGAHDIEIYLTTGEVANAEILWEDTVQDLAIIRSNISIPYLPIAESNNLNVGEDVIAVGTPLSLILKHSFTKGIVSALNRTLQVETSGGLAYMDNLIQHDASLNPGNSGGPLINTSGEVVGINTLKISGGEGIGFAIPSTSFSSLVKSIVVSKTSYQTPYLGVFGFDSEIAKFNNLTDQGSGYYVMDVAKNSPLYELGVNNGCVITKINDMPVSNTSELKQELYKYAYGDNVKIEFVKDGITIEKDITLSKNKLR